MDFRLYIASPCMGKLIRHSVKMNHFIFIEDIVYQVLYIDTKKAQINSGPFGCLFIELFYSGIVVWYMMVFASFTCSAVSAVLVVLDAKNRYTLLFFSVWYDLR